MNNSDRVYKLGKYLFALTGSDEETKLAAPRLFKAATESYDSDRVQRLNLDDKGNISPWPNPSPQDLAKDVIELIVLRAMRFHSDHIWMDAAALLSNDDRLVLICGQSQSGKTTVALALSLGFDWRIVTEDIALIDTRSGRLLTFATPLSIRSGTNLLIQNCLAGITMPSTLLRAKWLPILDRFADFDPRAKFDAIFHLSLGACRKSVLTAILLT